MSGYFAATNLPGFANWMRAQYEEEVVHGLKMFDYLHDRDGRPTLQAIDAPPADWKSPLDVFQKALEHERHVTALINALYAQALKEADYPSQVLLQWYISEQVEEEKVASYIVEQLKMIADNGSALILLDRELGGRKASGGAEAAGGAAT
jgi:ferritin